MNSNISSAGLNEDHHSSELYINSETSKSSNEKNNDHEKQYSQKDNEPAKKIHHNISSFSELGDFLSESTPTIPQTNNFEIESKPPPKQETPNKQKKNSNSKKKAQKRKPIKIDFSKIFSQDNDFGFVDNPKDKNANNPESNSNIHFPSFENEIVSSNNLDTTKNSNQQKQEAQIDLNNIIYNIENRIIDYFNHSIRIMISDFINDLRDLLYGMNSTELMIESFGMDLKRNIRQIVDLKSAYYSEFELQYIDSTLSSFKNLIFDIQQVSPKEMRRIHKSIQECRKSVASRIEIINSGLFSSIDQLHNELVELHNLQQSLLQRESKSDSRQSAIFQRLSNIEYSELLYKAESDLLSLQKSRSYLSTLYPTSDQDKKEMISNIYKFIKYYKRLQNDFYYRDVLKRCSRMINDSSDDFQNVCCLYNQQIGNAFKYMKYAQNQINSTLISNMRNTMINEQINWLNNKTIANYNSAHSADNAIDDKNNNPNEIRHEKEEIKKEKKKSHKKGKETHKNSLSYSEDFKYNDQRKKYHNYLK